MIKSYRPTISVRRLARRLFGWLGVLAAFPAGAEPIHLAVAANFSATINALKPAFEMQSSHTLLVSLGSSGKFFAQIQNGAPFQVFLSADEAKPLALESAGLSVPGSRFTYAIGSLALWSAAEKKVDDGIAVLRAGHFAKLAIANPKLAPYGAAALQVLKALNLDEETQSRWVSGENIAQTYQFVASGNADLGFVALSQIIHQGQLLKGSAWIVPDHLHSPIKQDAVLLKNAENNAAAKAFLEFLRSDEAKAIIATYGYRSE